MDGNYLPTDYQSFIHKSRYARWLDTEGRRESWNETVSRYVSNICKTNAIDTDTKKELYDAIISLASNAIYESYDDCWPCTRRDNTAGYNCSYLPVDDPKVLMKLCLYYCVVQVSGLVLNDNTYLSYLKYHHV